MRHSNPFCLRTSGGGPTQPSFAYLLSDVGGESGTARRPQPHRADKSFTRHRSTPVSPTRERGPTADAKKREAVGGVCLTPVRIGAGPSLARRANRSQSRRRCRIVREGRHGRDRRVAPGLPAILPTRSSREANQTPPRQGVVSQSTSDNSTVTACPPNRTSCSGSTKTVGFGPSKRNRRGRF
jgi:hypothetical protein